MTGSGNDFVMVDARVSKPDDWTPEDIRAACARGTGVGADGLVFIGPGAQPGAVRMIYFNSDGSHAAMCGNAALCSTSLAAHVGLGAPEGMDLETDAGTYQSRTAGPGRAELHLAPVDAPAPVAGLALAALRFDQAVGPEGANVNFISPGSSDGAWRMRTYERGVEAETLACGTGSVAAACALQEWGLGRLPINIVTRAGLLLEIRATRAPTGRYDDVWLAGEGRMVFRGVLT